MAAAANAERKTFMQLFPQLFLFPLLIVTVCVLVWLLFVASAQDNRTVDELLSDLESGGTHARKQDAYALAMKAREMTAAGEYFSREASERLLAFMERERQRQDDPEFLEFLVMAVGRGGEPAVTIPVMAPMALDDSGPLHARIWAVRALGLSGSSEAAGALLQLLDGPQDPLRWELRWNALGGLVNLREKRVVPHLRQAVGAPRRELSWSAACWLANSFGDDAGRSVLEALVDWEFLDLQVGDQGRELTHLQKEKYMLMALGGLARLGGPGVPELLKQKSEETRSPQVRDLALRLLQEAETGLRRSANPQAGPVVTLLRPAAGSAWCWS